MELHHRSRFGLLGCGLLLLGACRTPDASTGGARVVHARPDSGEAVTESLPYAPGQLPTDVVLLALVDEQGKVGEVRVEYAVTEAHAELAIATVRGWTFEPAVRDGVNVPELFRIPMSFPNGVPPLSKPDSEGPGADE